MIARHGNLTSPATNSGFLYHAFPRRGVNDSAKAVRILKLIRDHGLLLTPEELTWLQPLNDGTAPRTFEALQRRVCFTELNSTELQEHSGRFGNFILEFSLETARHLGATPVMYTPQALAGNENSASAISIAMLAAIFDSSVIMNRLAELRGLAENYLAENPNFEVSIGFRGEEHQTFMFNREQLKVVYDAISFKTTPITDLERTLEAMKSFFYHTDNIRNEIHLLEYYRQREWRIASEFAVNGNLIVQPISHALEDELLELDTTFFGRPLNTTAAINQRRVDHCLVYPGSGGRNILNFCNRIIVPAKSIPSVKRLIEPLENPPDVVAL